MNKARFFLSVLLIGIVVVLTFSWLRGSREESSAQRNEIQSTIGNLTNPSSADWVSKAITVDQLVLESNIIVRARVSELPVTRIVRSELPVWNEKEEIVGLAIDEMPFSDTVFEVLEIYLGKPPSKITVMQTGGSNPANPENTIEIADDPLYKVGEEYVLFLIDISGDPIQAPERELYRTVNPSGRYKIDGESVFSYGQNLELVSLPTTMIDLEAHIQQAIKENSLVSP